MSDSHPLLSVTHRLSSIWGMLNIGSSTYLFTAYPPPPPGYPLHRENRENGPKKIPVRENTGNLEILSNTRKTQGILSKHRENTGNCICSSGKCSDSKSKGHCDVCLKKKFSQFCVCNSHKLCKLTQGKFAVRQGKHRDFENTI